VKGHILVVDDDASMCDMLVSDLGDLGFEVSARTAAAAALDTLATREFDAVVTDLNMPGMNGLELCQRIVASQPDVPVIVITAFGSIQTAVAAIRGGAYDFVTKPLEVDALALALERAIQHRSLREEVRRLRRAVEEARQFGALLGTSPAMRRVYELLDRIVIQRLRLINTDGTGGSRRLASTSGVHEGRAVRITPPSRRPCSRASSSATCVAPSPTRTRRARDSSCRPAAGRSCSTRSATCRSASRPSSCARSRHAP
jgi:two-component system response regulator HydG